MIRDLWPSIDLGTIVSYDASFFELDDSSSSEFYFSNTTAPTVHSGQASQE